MVEAVGLAVTIMSFTTVTIAVPVTPLFEPVAVIVAVPSATPVTSPSASTVAMLTLLELQVKDVSSPSVDVASS